MPLTVGSLFAGIGGFDLGFERAGFEIKWQVEIDPFCRAVLAKHWPQVRRYEDVRTVGAELERVDVICGGFPCQDISSNNQYKRGVAGEKSGLFTEAIRLADTLRPRYLLLENVADLLVRGMGEVLGSLAARGFDAEWDCFPAAALGLPQPRWRVFIIAYLSCGRRKTGYKRNSSGPFAFARIDSDGLAAAELSVAQGVARLGGMDDGFPGRMDRIAACGNAVSPIVAQWIAERIKAAEGVR